jgi:hypothetical protein
MGVQSLRLSSNSTYLKSIGLVVLYAKQMLAWYRFYIGGSSVV